MPPASCNPKQLILILKFRADSLRYAPTVMQRNLTQTVVLHARANPHKAHLVFANALGQRKKNPKEPYFANAKMN